MLKILKDECKCKSMSMSRAPSTEYSTHTMQVSMQIANIRKYERDSAYSKYNKA